MLAAADQNQKLKKARGESLGSPSEAGFPAPSAARLAVNSTATEEILGQKRSRGMKCTRAPHREQFYYRISKRFTNTSAEQRQEVHTGRYTRENKGNGLVAARAMLGQMHSSRNADQQVDCRSDPTSLPSAWKAKMRERTSGLLHSLPFSKRNENAGFPLNREDQQPPCRGTMPTRSLRTQCQELCTKVTRSANPDAEKCWCCRLLLGRVQRPPALPPGEERPFHGVMFTTPQTTSR